MSTSSRKKLNQEDRLLWGRVARTVAPLAGRHVPEDSEEQPDFEREIERFLAEPQDFKPRPGERRGAVALNGRPAPLEAPTRRRLAKGRTPIDASLDLHDLSQIEAHRLLLLFLQRAHADHLRHVLIITGKGSSPASEGILRRAVPMWLATAPFRPLVGGFHPAARHHGGAGALYVRLRRPTERHGS